MIPSPALNFNFGCDLKTSEGFEIQPYFIPSWTSAAGVFRKMKRIKKNGMPNLRGAKRLTLTSDLKANGFESYLESALAMLSQFTRFIRNLRLAYYNDFKAPLPEYAMWIEFHESGAMHFHMDWLCYRRLPAYWWMNAPELGRCGLLTQLWKLGNVHMTRIKRTADNYAFKYAFKPEGVELDDGTIALPKWFAEAEWTELVPVKDGNGNSVRDKFGKVVYTEKRKTFRRLRMWRTSKGFYDRFTLSDAAKDAGVKIEAPHSILNYQLPETFKRGDIRVYLRALIKKEGWVLEVHGKNDIELSYSADERVQERSEMPFTIAESHHQYEKKARLTVRDDEGKYIASAVIEFSDLAGSIQDRLTMKIFSGDTRSTKYGLLCPKELIINELSKHNITQIEKITWLHNQRKKAQARQQC